MRLRVKFHKQGALRYIGHLDLHKIWERSTRRANISLMYSQGFHPQPKIQIASALPLGFSSKCEIVDMWTSFDYDTDAVKNNLQSAVPDGLRIESVSIVSEPSPPLQVMTASAVFDIQIPASARKGLGEKIDAVLLRTSIERIRRNKPYDLRPLIEELSLTEEGLTTQLSAKEGATGRPEELLDELGVSFESCFIERTDLIFKQNITTN